MMTNRIESRVAPRRTSSDEAVALLRLVYELTRTGCQPELGVLARRLGWGVGRVVRVLEHLGQKGMVDRATYRLTMGGLAVAASLTASERRSGAAA